MKTSEVLHKAADLIEEHGHATGSGWPGAVTFEGRYCLEGAVMGALGLTYDESAEDDEGYEGGVGYQEFRRCPAHKAVCEYLNDEEVNPHGLAPWGWQDDLESTWFSRHDIKDWDRKKAAAYAKQRVLEVLRGAAAVEELKEATARGPLHTDGDTVRVPSPRTPQPGEGARA